MLPDDKSTWIALTNIYGIGRVRSQKILNKVGIDPMKKVKDLTEEDQKKDFRRTQKLRSWIWSQKRGCCCN